MRQGRLSPASRWIESSLRTSANRRCTGARLPHELIAPRLRSQCRHPACHFCRYLSFYQRAWLWRRARDPFKFVSPWSSPIMGHLVRSIAVGRKASALFKALARVEVTFNPFDAQATTARYVLFRKRSLPLSLLPLHSRASRIVLFAQRFRLLSLCVY